MREMKDSGVEWIGEIPKNWESRKIKYIATLSGRIGWQGLTSDEYADEGAYLITGINFKNGTIDWDSCVHVPMSRWEEATQIQIKSGDLLITKDGTVGKVAIAENVPAETSLNSGVLLIRNKDECNTRFLFWVIQSEVFWKWFSIINSGNSTIIHLYQQDFYNFAFPFPPLEEQRQLASYLDIKCAKIDSIIEKQQAIIEKLKEYKLSVITEAVTKGLNPNVEMKDSGVEWIGKIPNNYVISTFKRYCNVNQGLQIAQSERKLEDGDGRYKYITVKFLNSDDQDNMVEYIENPPGSTICCEDDILMARTGATGLVVTGVKGCFHNNFFRINYNKKNLEHDYLVYYLMQDSIKSYLLRMAGTTTIPDLNHGDFYSTPLVIPPIEEQIIISAYLLEKCSTIDKLIEKKNEVITKLFDYKKSLIYEVVTGKKEV